MLSEITSGLCDVPYKLGGCSPSDGYDCLQLVVIYLRRSGVDINPKTTHKGINFKNYVKKYLEDPEVIEVAIDYFSKRFEEIDPCFGFAGDLIVYEIEGSKRRYLAIDAGNGNMLVANDKIGTTMVSQSDYNIVKAIRCQTN